MKYSLPHFWMLTKLCVTISLQEISFLSSWTHKDLTSCHLFFDLWIFAYFLHFSCEVDKLMRPWPGKLLLSVWNYNRLLYYQVLDHRKFDSTNLWALQFVKLLNNIARIYAPRCPDIAMIYKQRFSWYDARNYYCYKALCLNY